MESGNSRALGKNTMTPSGPHQQQTTQAQRAPPPVSAASNSTIHRYATPNQLPPIQSSISPKTEPSGAGMRSYMVPISRASPRPNSSTMPNPPHPARPASGYPPSSLPAHSQSSYPTAHVMTPNASSGPSTAAGTNSLPLISGTYARSPTFSSSQTSAIPPIKGSMQQSASNHPTLSPLSGQPVVAHDESVARTATYGSPPATQTPMPRMPPPQSMSSPGARPVSGSQGLAVQAPHPHQSTASAPPPKQIQSPRTHRAISAQSTPLPLHAQQSPRATAVGGVPHASSTGPIAGSTFTTTPKSSLMPTSMAALASTAVPPLGPSHSMGTVSRAVPATANSQSSGLAISGGQSSVAVTSSIAASAPVSAGVGGNTEQAHSRQQQQSQTQPDASGRPLNVTDALSYLDMVKSQFQDRPEVYNQFLEIMKEFKSHAIDTPGVINRVSRLFFGSQSLIQGFNTFLPPGYRIECSDDPAEGVRVTTPSGSIIPDMNRQIGAPASMGVQNHPQSPQSASMQPIAQRAPQQQQQQHYGARDQYGARRTGPQGTISSGMSVQGMQVPASQTMAAHGGPYPSTTMSGAAGGPISARSPSAVRSPTLSASQRSRQVPVEFNHAITYVNKIKMRFAAEPDRYKEFLEILQTYQKESRPIQEVYGQVQHLFLSAPDLLDEFKQFLPDTSDSSVSELAAFGSTNAAYARMGQVSAAGNGIVQGQLEQTGTSSQHGMNGTDTMVGGRLPPLGNFAPAAGAASLSVDPFAAGPTGGSISAASGAGQASGMAYEVKGPGNTPGGSRKRRGVMSGTQGSGVGSAKRRSRSAKAEGDGATGYGQLLTAAQQQQQAANPATATPEELAFFERVKRFIGQPNAYNEFLKLLNLYNQQVLDPRTLVERAESFIGDDSELFGWFKQFVGFDEQQTELEDSRSGDEDVIESILGPEPKPYMPPEEVAKTLRATRPKVSLAQCKSYGPSYRLLPDASTKAKCSGRDAMCYEVLNDRWASHPTWASEDTEFVHHKKNQFEEAMFRSEEDRHEMDIEIDTNLSVIRQLTPFAQQIEQMGADRQTQVVLPENFLGMSEALPRRALRKVYDSNRALEIIKAMHTHPVVAIPIVLKRLKQKDEEWRRQRREYAKIWRESDSKNYYRALDHQGLTFKSVDRKNISPKHFITEIETRRREQQNLMPDESSGTARAQNRKVTSALRHRYQLEYRFSESTVIADVINAILAHVGRQNSQFAPTEKEMMERFFHELFGGLLGIESPDHLQSVSDNEENPSDEDVETGVADKISTVTPAVNGHALNGNVDTTKAEESNNGDSMAITDAVAATAVADTPTDPKDTLLDAASGDAMDIDKSNGDNKESDALDLDKADLKDSVNDADETEKAVAKLAIANGHVNGTAKSPRGEEGSKPSTPGLISSRSWIQIGSAARDPSAAPSLGTTAKSVSRAFYTNSSYYVFLRLFQVLYERFNRLRELGPECQTKVIQAHQSQSVATKLGLRPELDVLKPYDLEHTDYYAIFLELVDQFLQGQLENNSFDEAMRVMYGINAYKILTVDKVVQAISKSIQNLINDTRCIDILELFTTLPPVHEQSPLRSHIAYRMKVEALVGADEHVFRVDYIYDSQTMTIQLLRREDITLDEAVTEEERWAYYVDSYVLFEPTEGVPQLLQLRPRPYLRRHLHADECDYVISSRSNLEIKIAVNTYKLCFLTGTEDIYANHSRRAQLATDKAAQSACKEQWATRTQKWHEWLQNEHQQRLAEAVENNPEEQLQLSEWWK